MRSVGLRVLAGVFAASWLVLPGFGLVDLAVTWSPDWPQVLEAGWGVFFTFLVGSPFVLVAIRPRSSAPAAVQLVVAATALAVSAPAASEWPLLWLVALLAVQIALVGALAPPAWVVLPAAGVSAPLLALAAAGAAPWLVYALDMWSLSREGRPDADITMGIDHYAVQGALGLALVALPLLAGVRAGLRPFVPACAGIAGAYLGLVSLAWPGAAGGFGRAWSGAALAWGLALVAVALARPLGAVGARARRSA
ncbi:MAG TPA: hypothetical protein VFR43_05095 [Gaiellaceae bacterium]|nr:hypothetical protein [Gaiellaceae bacterium]